VIKLKSKTDLSDLLILICDFYNAYRETLNYNHEQAKHRIINMYDDLHKWLYDEEEQC
jgi:hypothetical protein